MSVTLKIVLAAVLAAIGGIVIGIFIGRFGAESKWSQPYATVTPDEAKKYAADDADPTAPAGRKIAKAMPLAKTRAAVNAMTKDDKAHVLLGSSFGQGDEGVELHVTVENRGTCTINGGSGVAYGFDARGRSGKANKHGEHYVAFKIEKPIEPGKKDVIAQKMRYADDVTLAVAQVDETTCSNGPAWKRQ
jgi:hypothetical protein